MEQHVVFLHILHPSSFCCILDLMYEDAAVGEAGVGNVATDSLEVLQISSTFDEVKATAFEIRAFLAIVHKLEYEAYSHTVCQISCSSSLDPA